MEEGGGGVKMQSFQQITMIYILLDLETVPELRKGHEHGMEQAKVLTQGIFVIHPKKKVFPTPRALK